MSDLGNYSGVIDLEKEISYYKNIEERVDWVISVVYFGHHPLDLVVTGSLDKNIRIFSTLNQKLVKKFFYPNISLGMVMQFSKDIFLGLAGDGLMIAFSISKLEKIKEVSCMKKMGEQGEVKQAVKLDDDLLLCVLGNRGSTCIVSYSRDIVVKKLESLKPYGVSSKVILSKNYKNCFYLNCMDSGKVVYLYNYEKNSPIVKFTEHDTCDIWTMSVYQNKRNEEILFYGGTQRVLYFYNLGVSLFDSCFNNSVKTHNDFMCYKIKVDHGIISSLFLKDKNLVFGDSKGRLNILDLKYLKFEDNKKPKKPNNAQGKDNEVKYGVIVSKEIHEKYVFCISRMENEFILSGCYDGLLVCSKLIGNLDGIKENSVGYEETDLTERIEFLFDGEIKKDIFEEKTFIKIKFPSFSFEKVFKCFLNL